MGKAATSAEYVLNQLGELSTQLARTTHAELGDEYFHAPLRIIHQALGFHISVLYKISNVIENDLILEVASVFNPHHVRPDLAVGAKICLDINRPPPQFVNEVAAFRSHGVAAINVPGWGCDLVGSIYLPENLGHGYLLAGDYFSAESGTQAYDVRACEIMCNLLSSALMKAQFETLACYDGLTGLLNSRAIRDELEKVFQRQKRKGNRLGAIVLADIDHFKKINDQYGHLQGDSVLQEVGHLIAAASRKHIDVVGRYGGEEFLLLYEDMDVAQVESVTERLRQTIDAHPFVRIGTTGVPLEGESLHVTMSFGIALLDDPSLARSQEILSRADAALYRSKAAGRNRVTRGAASTKASEA